MKNFLRTAIAMTTMVSLATVASAGDDKAVGKPVPAAKVEPTKTAPTPAKIDGKPAVPMTMPTPPVEVATMAKGAAGTWKCKGQAIMPDGTAVPMMATMKVKLDLDKYWLRSTFAETGKKAGAYKFESFTTYDAGTKKWHRLHADSMGNSETTTSDGLKDGKVTWEGSSRSHMGAAKVRHHEEMVGKELKMVGEYSMDGKTWSKGYEAACKK